MEEFNKFDKFDFATLQALARNNNLKFNFKTKGPLIKNLIANNIEPPKKFDKKSKHLDTEAETEVEISESDSEDEWYESSIDQDMEWESSFTPTSVRIHTNNVNPKELKHIKEILVKLNSSNKLNELERVQKYVFNQLGIL